MRCWIFKWICPITWWHFMAALWFSLFYCCAYYWKTDCPSLCFRYSGPGLSCACWFRFHWAARWVCAFPNGLCCRPLKLLPRTVSPLSQKTRPPLVPHSWQKKEEYPILRRLQKRSPIVPLLKLHIRPITRTVYTSGCFLPAMRACSSLPAPWSS